MSQYSSSSEFGNQNPGAGQLFEPVIPITFDPSDFPQTGSEISKELTDDISPVQYPCINAGTCPDCGAGMVRLGSCYSCPCCGFGGCAA